MNYFLFLVVVDELDFMEHGFCTEGGSFKSKRPSPFAEQREVQGVKGGGQGRAGGAGCAS